MNEHVLILLPLLIPLVTASVCVMLASAHARFALGAFGAALETSAAVWLLMKVHVHGVLTSRLGQWPPPFGIAFAADRLSAIMVLAASVIALLGTFYSLSCTSAEVRKRFIPLLHLLLGGMGGFFLTADLFNFYVWFELILVSSFGLMVLDGQRAEVEGTMKYFAMNALGSLLLLTAIGLVYASTKTLDFAQLAHRIGQGDAAFFTAIAGLFLIALALKSAVFPVFFWLPASYHTLSIPVLAVFGGVLTKVGVYGLVRIFTLLFSAEPHITHRIILVLGGFTMATGVLGAVAQHDVRRLLSFHIISQIGYMMMGLGLFSHAGLAAALFFVIHIIVVKTSLFFMSGMMHRLCGSYDLDHISGLYENHPKAAAVFLIGALSLGGIPPLSGFVAKLSLVQAALAQREFMMVAVALGVSLLTLYSMAKIWTLGFWKEAVRPQKERPTIPAAMWIPTTALCLLAVALGVGGSGLMQYTQAAADQLMGNEQYLEALSQGGSR